MRSFLVLSFLFLAATPLATSQTTGKTNYGGKWRMVKEKSEFGKFSAPNTMVRSIDQQDVTINVHTVETGPGGKASADVTYYTDGRESTNDVHGRESKSRCFWDGAVLVIRTVSTAGNGQALTTEQRWELSQDGKTLTMTSHMETGLTQADFKLVCERMSE